MAVFFKYTWYLYQYHKVTKIVKCEYYIQCKVQPLVHVMEPGCGVSWLTGPWWSWRTKHTSVNKYGYRHDYSSNPYHSSTTWGRGTLKYLHQMRTMNNARADKVILSQTSPPKQESRMLEHYSRAENVKNWLWEWTGMALKSQNSVTLDGIHHQWTPCHLDTPSYIQQSQQRWYSR